MVNLWFRYIGSLWILTVWLCLSVTPNATAQAGEAGDIVRNIASVSFSTSDADLTFETNPAEFTIQDPPPDPTISFFRFAPTAPDPINRRVNGSEFAILGGNTVSSGSVSPDGTLFKDVPPAVTTAGEKIDLSKKIPLFPATAFVGGETVFVQVTDVRVNRLADEIETAVVTVRSNTGDTIVIRLFESEEDSSEFWGYFPTTLSESPEFDNKLTTGPNDQFVAQYDNGFLQNEIVTDTAVVDSFGRVFDSTTGELIDGATIRLVNAGNQTSANVLGVDGFSTYPSDVISGSPASDSSGREYPSGTGEFRFPLAETGEYYVEVVPPDGYDFASSQSSSYFERFEKFSVSGASFGERFSVEALQGIQFDIPLDPQAELVITKTVDATTADVGDFVPYMVTIENIGASSVPVNLQDMLPVGFRYVPASARLEGELIADPEIADTATRLNFPLGVLPAGETITLNYTLEVGPGAPLGSAINEAVVLDRDGDQISNIGRAEITLREDLYRTRSTIIGRVSEQSCDANAGWAREIRQGVGVPGVRIYMETGAYAVTDGFGLFHFEGVDENTHVVQIDEETLPEGYEPIVCEENSRYANRATSKFIEAQGGGIWRANFYLKKTSDVAKVKNVETYDSQTAYKDYDAKWLAKQSGEPKWVYPDSAQSPSHASLNFGITHRPGDKLKARINGKEIDKRHITSRENNALGLASITRWRGVDLIEGENYFEIDVRDKNGQLTKTLKEMIVFVKDVARATPVIDQSILVADGRTVPEIAIRFEDEAGRQVHPGRIVDVDVVAPYRAYSETGELDRLVQSNDQLAPLSARTFVSVGDRGIARVRLEPTLQTGKVTVVATLDNGRKVPIYMYLAPEKRDWILVGLAEGSVGFENIRDQAVRLGESDDNLFDDGRVAFFAKGLIKGEWLLTLAVDSLSLIHI